MRFKMTNYRRELFREVMSSSTNTGKKPELKDWSRLMKERERRIFDLMRKEASQRLMGGTSPPTHEDRLNETIRKGMWVPSAPSNS
jgi:hypothetical protein